MNKRRQFTLNGKNYEVLSGYPTCQGCENLTIGPGGWGCMFNGEDGQGCEYPESIAEKGATYLGEVHNLSAEWFSTLKGE